ncbi:FkbM family methyltransferase [Fodinicurvata sp. EGI_FJ10296]|uniref:FkbM family methyltransferase n=1 Tax=Fodinicurvata sp. EGI_FJ10296 TaxID=3231908 RepID=UPI003452D002
MTTDLAPLSARAKAAAAFRLARLLGRTEVTVGGSLGRFTGHTDDAVMLRHYGRTGTWSAAGVNALAAAARAAARDGLAPLLVDVGASVGLVTAGILGQAPGTALALEPDPETFSMLVRNMASAGLNGRVTTLRRAAGAANVDATGAPLAARMVRTPGNGGDIRVASVAPHNECQPEAAPLSTLDGIVPLNDKSLALLLKIDTQGHEPDVLAGAPGALARATLTMVEFWPHGLRQMGHDPASFATRLMGRVATGMATAALLHDEHTRQEIVWQTPETVLQYLLDLCDTADDPGRQVEVLLRPSQVYP